MDTDKIDRYGHCVNCCKNLIVKRVVDGKVVEMFSPLHDHTEFILDNGSRMRVCICKDCKSSINLSDNNVQKDIMKAVNKGWELETKSLVKDDKFPDWTPEYGKKYLDRMAKLSIGFHSENMDDNSIVEKIKNIRGVKDVVNTDT